MLDELKRQKIIALLANGSSRRMAAKYAHCAPSTITHTAALDPHFAAQLAAAEQTAEIDALRYIRAAYRKDRYWRAAAWLLERKNPEDFARRPPTLFTGEEVFNVISQIVEVLHNDLPEVNCQRAIEKLEQILEACRLEQSTPKLPKTTGDCNERGTVPLNPLTKTPGDCPNFHVNENGTVPLYATISNSASPNPQFPTSSMPHLKHTSFEPQEVPSTPPDTTPNLNTTSAPQH